MLAGTWLSRAVTYFAGQKPARRVLAIVISFTLMAAVGGLARARSTREAAVRRQEDRTAVVEKRDFVRTLRLNGVLEASRSILVSAPRLGGQGGWSPLIITKLALAGTTVKAGDLLVEFDRQSQIKNYLEREAEHLGLLEDLKRKRAEQDSAISQDEAEMKKAQHDVERARLDVRKSEVLSRIDAEKNAHALEESTLRLEQLRRKWEMRRQAAAADLRALEIRAERAQRAMAHAQRNMDKLEVRAAIDGIVVLTPIWKGNGPADVQEGDEVRPGSSFLQVVDPATMQVRIKVNQADLHRLKAGQRTRIRLDAYPDVELTGRVDQLGAVGSSTFSDRVRTFIATIAIDAKDARMMPDLSAAVDVELERAPDVLVLPRDAVRDEGEGRGAVRLPDGRSRNVKIGPRSDHEVVIVSGLDPGATVVRGSDGG
jgi:HlyD family secretion protein